MKRITAAQLEIKAKKHVNAAHYRKMSDNLMTYVTTSCGVRKYNMIQYALG